MATSTRSVLIRKVTLAINTIAISALTLTTAAHAFGGGLGGGI